MGHLDENMRNIHEYDIEMVKVVKEICQKLNLKTYMLGGTMLGAIRHKGFIPWDDDVDLGMFREDYNKFLEEAQKYLPSNMKLEHFKINPKYIYYSARIIHLDAEVEEERVGRYYAGIDIFPIDGTPNNIVLRNIYYFRVFFHKAIMSMCDKTHFDKKRKRSLIEKIIISVMSKLPFQLFTSAYKEKVIIDKLLSKNRIEESKYIGNIMGAYRTREIIPKEIYGEGRMYQFEDIQLRGMEKYHEYLSMTYGDYMKLPPVENRKSHYKLVKTTENFREDE